MATYDELMAAARKADSQGATDDARRLLQLAAEKRRAQSAPTFEEIMRKADAADRAGNTQDARELVAMARQTRAGEEAQGMSVENLIAGARRAEAAGDTAAAERLKQAARNLHQQQLRASQDGSALDTFSDFGRGITQGAVNVSRAGQKLLWHGAGALGFDGASDMLDIVNAKNADDARDNAQYCERSPRAFGAGEVVGETLATLPAGGAGGAAAKTGLTALRSGVSLGLGGRAVTSTGLMTSAAGLAGEGAAVGALMSGGEGIAENAAKGAALNVAGGALIHGVTRVSGEVARTLLRRPRAEAEVVDSLDSAAQRVKQAAEDGGYTLDGATAHATSRSFDEVARLRQDPAIDQRFLRHAADVEGQVTARAQGLAERYGPTRDLQGMQEAYSAPQRTLTAMRMLDERAYRNAYREFDRLAAETRTALPTAELSAKLSDFLTQNGNAASENLAGKISRDLARYGIKPRTLPTVRTPAARGAAELEVLARNAPDPYGVSTGKRKPAPDPYHFPPARAEPGPTVKGGGKSSTVEVEDLRGRNTHSLALPRDEAPKPLTLENVEDLIQDINAHWSPNLSEGEKRYMGQVKSMLEQHVDSALLTMGETAGQGSAVYRAGQRARAARRAYSERWTANDIVQKVTERTEGGEWALDYSQIAQKLSGQDGHRHLRTIKARLLTAKNGDKAWRSMQQAPLLEALHAATKDTSEQVMEGGVVRFNHKKFEEVLNRQLKTGAAKEVLWGADGAREIQQAIDAWKLRTRRPSVAGSANPSGTAMTLLKQLRFLPSGRARGVASAVTGALPLVGPAIQRGAREQAADAVLFGGTVPQRVQDEMAADVLARWETEFVGAGGLKYGDMLRRLLRTGVTVQVTDE